MSAKAQKPESPWEFRGAWWSSNGSPFSIKRAVVTQERRVACLTTGMGTSFGPHDSLASIPHMPWANLPSLETSGRLGEL